jgi:hypothetical protein
MSTEIETLRAENTRLRAENESLRRELDRCRQLARETREMLAEHHQLGQLIELLKAQRPPRRMSGNGYSAARRY